MRTLDGPNTDPYGSGSRIAQYHVGMGPATTRLPGQFPVEYANRMTGAGDDQARAIVITLYSDGVPEEDVSLNGIRQLYTSVQWNQALEIQVLRKLKMSYMFAARAYNTFAPVIESQWEAYKFHTEQFALAWESNLENDPRFNTMQEQEQEQYMRELVTAWQRTKDYLMIREIMRGPTILEHCRDFMGLRPGNMEGLAAALRSIPEMAVEGKLAMFIAMVNSMRTAASNSPITHMVGPSAMYHAMANATAPIAAMSLNVIEQSAAASGARALVAPPGTGATIAGVQFMPYGPGQENVVFNTPLPVMNRAVTDMLINTVGMEVSDGAYVRVAKIADYADGRKVELGWVPSDAVLQEAKAVIRHILPPDTDGASADGYMTLGDWWTVCVYWVQDGGASGRDSTPSIVRARYHRVRRLFRAYADWLKVAEAFDAHCNMHPVETSRPSHKTTKLPRLETGSDATQFTFFIPGSDTIAIELDMSMLDRLKSLNRNVGVAFENWLDNTAQNFDVTAQLTPGEVEQVQRALSAILGDAATVTVDSPTGLQPHAQSVLDFFNIKLNQDFLWQAHEAGLQPLVALTVRRLITVETSAGIFASLRGDTRPCIFADAMHRDWTTDNNLTKMRHTERDMRGAAVIAEPEQVCAIPDLMYVAYMGGGFAGDNAYTTMREFAHRATEYFHLRTNRMSARERRGQFAFGQIDIPFDENITSDMLATLGAIPHRGTQGYSDYFDETTRDGSTYMGRLYAAFAHTNKLDRSMFSNPLHPYVEGYSRTSAATRPAYADRRDLFIPPVCYRDGQENQVSYKDDREPTTEFLPGVSGYSRDRLCPTIVSGLCRGVDPGARRSIGNGVTVTPGGLM
jgi:hypothetical protein